VVTFIDDHDSVSGQRRRHVFRAPQRRQHRSALPGFLVFPTLRINRPARAEQIEKQGDFLRGCGRSPRCRERSRGIVLELSLGLKGDKFVLGLEKLSRKFGQSSPEIGRA